jgi:hypothetical protein
MQVINSSFTIAEYCGQLSEKSIVVNRQYQRSEKVWPTPARSYLIDTILSGFPIPKLALYQKTDLRTRRTIKEIVDGQQRSMAILDFFNDKFKLAGKSGWAGKRYSDLEDDEKERFLQYYVSCDVFVGASEPEIRQVFQRMNSYQVPLNKQEQRHATYQGIFKWFSVSLSEKYSQLLKDIGVFGDRQLIRMYDAALFTDVIYTLENGIESASEPKFDAFYKEHDERFEETRYSKLIDQMFADIISFQELHNGPLMKAYHFYTLLLALAHVYYGPREPLQRVIKLDAKGSKDRDKAVYRLSQLAAALEEPDETPDYSNFILASSKGTNRINQREERFRWMCVALADLPNPL